MLLVPLQSRLIFCTPTSRPRFARRFRLTRFWGTWRRWNRRRSPPRLARRAAPSRASPAHSGRACMRRRVLRSSSARHTRKAEHVNGVIADVLRSFSGERADDWRALVPLVATTQLRPSGPATCPSTPTAASTPAAP